MTRTDAFLTELRREFPKFRLVPKTGDRFSELIDYALRLVTLGAQRDYLTRYSTVIGFTLYVTAEWNRMADVDRVITLRHERIHLRQGRRYTPVGMALLYLFVPCPLGLAYARARIEWEAYTETIVATAELRGLAAAEDPALREHIVRQFVSGAYGWMWPFKKHVEAWYDAVLTRVRQETSTPS